MDGGTRSWRRHDGVRPRSCGDLCILGGDGGGLTPAHTVNVTKPFYLGKYTVTQKQWEAVMGAGNNPSSFKVPENPMKMLVGRIAKHFSQT